MQGAATTQLPCFVHFVCENWRNNGNTGGARARLLGIITIHTGCVCAWGDEQKRFFSHAFTLEGLPGGRKGELVMVKYCYTKCFFHLYNCLIVSDESLSLKAEPIDVCTATKKANQL